MKKFKGILLFMGVGFLLSMAMLVYDKFTYFEPMDKTEIEAHVIGASATLDERLRKEGCYEVGVSSYEPLFSMGRAIDGHYKLQIYHDNTLLEEKIIDKPLAIGAHSRTDYTNALLHVFAVPLKGYGKLTFKLTVLKADSILKDGSKQVYFYVNKSDYICGQAQTKIDEQTQIDNLTIDTNETNQTLLPLSKALGKLDTAKVKQLIEKSLSVNVKMVANRTPLHYAAYLNDIQTARYLSDHGADIDATDIQGHTPLYYAIDHNATKTVKLLLDKGADPRKVRFLSDSERNVPHLRSNGYPALLHTAYTMNFELTELLLKSKKIDINEKYEGWNTYDYLDHGYQLFYDVKSLDKNKLKKMLKVLEKYGLVTANKPIVYPPGGPAPSTIKALEPAIKFDEIKEN
ncbi:MAG: ankyrin repeat domain-containing protein [Methylococcales bacterium]|nr:ankyrin repeat domain-containing protein [Methylococcales bacterium]